MKRFYALASSLLAVSLLMTLPACTDDTLPNANAEQSGTEASFSLLGGEQAETNATRARHAHRGPMMMKWLLKDLDLSPEQSAQFQALQQEAQNQMQHKKPAHKALRAKIKTAFLAESFDAAALKAEIKAQSGAAMPQAETMASHLLKAWQILTPAQREKLEARLQGLEQRFEKHQGQAAERRTPKAGKSSRLEKLAAKLNLSETQQAELQALWQAGQPLRQTHLTEMKTHKAQLFAALKSGQTDPAALAALLPGDKLSGNLDTHIDQLAQLHGILNPEQRQQMLELMQHKKERMMKRGPQHKQSRKQRNSPIS